MNRRNVLKVAGFGGVLGLSSAGVLAAAGEEESSIFDEVVQFLAKADGVAHRLGLDDPQLRPAYHQHVMMILVFAYLQVFGTRIERPEWLPYIPFYLPWGGPNADDVYRFVPIDSRGTYRVFGVKGTAPIAVIGQKNSGVLMDKASPGKTLAQIDLNAIQADGDGRYSFILSRERPLGHEDGWQALHPDTTQLLYRSCTKNASQRDPICEIERLDGSLGPAVPSRGEMRRKASDIGKFARAQNSFLLGYLDGVRKRGGDRRFVAMNMLKHGGMPEQLYLMNLFTIKPGEALILDSVSPKRFRYWSVNLFDQFFDGVDYVHRQSSLNDEQVRIDSDGRVRMIVSAEDPGVPNWLDTGAWLKGGLMWRWNNCDSYPVPTVTKVLLRDVRRHIPQDTPRVTAVERQASLRERSAYYQTRSS